MRHGEKDWPSAVKARLLGELSGIDLECRLTPHRNAPAEIAHGSPHRMSEKIELYLVT
jgi:hypothetical protein